MSDKIRHSLSTAFASRATGDRNAATSLRFMPHSRAPNDGGARIKESSRHGWAMLGTKKDSRSDRAEIASARRELQGNPAEVEREREEYYETTWPMR